MASNPATINLVQEIESVMSPIDVAALHSDQLRDLVVQTDVAIRQLQALQGSLGCDGRREPVSRGHNRLR
jgi:hypothetical protein